ncbi:PLP-dependent aminotransferase family protein [Patulibacter minatonensis]|uniref:MocR-like pyridoxine biosynthesis transcription factor PdxR n=1 Tax=Patulibacter minatonensis TaxID=298163 RepID=UPI00047959C4|nr:PLP-dependent aminotransferase family protein [Patulibacter minatonensis]
MGDQRGPVGGLPVEVDPEDPRPLHEQLEQGIRAAVRDGRLAPGQALPSTRGLGAELGLSRGVISAAYAQLAAEGYLLLRQGAPARVSDAIRGTTARPAARSLARAFAYDLRPGLPDLVGFPRQRWQRALARGWAGAPAATLGEVDPRGVPQLRDALAAYLDRARGTSADPELMLVCTGFTQGLSLVCRWLREYGVDRIATEDPGWHPHRLVAEQAGLQVVGLPVDEDGVDVAALEDSGATVVVLTPAHQFPTGAVLAPERRRRLVEWAETHDGLIVEDDYDSELRYDRTAVGALQGLAPDRVLHVGSAGKRLAPGLRLGWMLVPSWLIWPLVTAKAIEDQGSEVLGQLAFADLLSTGDLDRHLRRMRLRYAERRVRLLRAVEHHLPGVRTGDDPAGLHELLLLPDGTDEPAVLAAAARRGVGLEGLALHRHDGRAGRPGVLAGYAATTPPAIDRAIALLAEAVAEVG